MINNIGNIMWINLLKNTKLINSLFTKWKGHNEHVKNKKKYNIKIYRWFFEFKFVVYYKKPNLFHNKFRIYSFKDVVFIIYIFLYNCNNNCTKIVLLKWNNIQLKTRFNLSENITRNIKRNQKVANTEKKVNHLRL